MFKNKNFIIIVIIIIFSTIIGSLALYTTKNRQRNKFENNLKTHSIFSSEKEYINHLKENVRFNAIKFYIVDIKRGDNFWKIAKKYGVNIDTLLGTNPYWHTLIARINQKIVVPSQRGVLHFINDFDEIEELMRIYNIKRDNILTQELPPLYRYYYRFFGNDSPIAVFIRDAKPTTIAMTDKMAKQFCLREMFRSPIGGRFSSYFGGRIHPIFKKHRFHNGVDIAARYGTPVGASCRGTVVATGWMGGYGKAIIISHPNGFRTLYGHLSRIYVKRGQYVRSGRIIGRAGSTGWSTGSHLHFTLWHNGKLINPLKVLW
jgi:murein DD-endopeptidase MepM/ murein hydrolase activator NlpD